MSAIELRASDGHTFGAWQAEPTPSAKGAIVVIQEIFGVNSHIRAVTEGYAAAGYLALAPAFFDRIERDYETGYGAQDIEAGRERVGRLDWANTLADLSAAVAHAKAQLGGDAKVAVVGFCWGGTVAWRAAAKTDGIAASVPYYGGMIADFLDDRPRVPVLAHFGEQDTRPAPQVGQALAQRYPEQVEVHFYAAGHGFSCDQRASFDAAAAQSAHTRTLAFLAKHLAP